MFKGIYRSKPDKYCRITLPKAFFGDISTTDELVLVGVGDHCELWTKADWERRLEEITTDEIDNILEFLKDDINGGDYL